jgi:predicted ATP-grasp superfamily ATP-dependent carboligase
VLAYLCTAGEVNQIKCEDKMNTIIIELTGNNSLKALQDLEQKHLIRILKEPDLSSYSLTGEPISNEDFRKWVEYAENSPTVSLNEAKQRWTQQKKSLQKLIR